MSAGVFVELPHMPRVALWRLALARKPGLTAGQHIAPVRVRVCGQTLGDSAEYRRLCSFPAQGPMPLTWPFVVAAPVQKAALVRPEFPVPLMGMVHLRQTVWAARPLDPTERVDIEVGLGPWRPARRGVEFDVQTTVFDGRGVAVWRGTTTAWSPHGPGHGEDRTRPTAPEFADEITVKVAVPEWMGRRYGKVAGDGNPIHMHRWLARPFGFPKAIVHGMWTLGRMLAAMEDRVPQREVHVACWFRKPVFLPDEITLRAGPTSDGTLGFRVDGSDRCRLWGVVGRTPDTTGESPTLR